MKIHTYTGEIFSQQVQQLSLCFTEKYCHATFDNIMCWPRTRAGTTLEQDCPNYINNFDTRGICVLLPPPPSLTLNPLPVLTLKTLGNKHPYFDIAYKKGYKLNILCRYINFQSFALSNILAFKKYTHTQPFSAFCVCMKKIIEFQFDLEARLFAPA